jgi:hypothetical protein
MTATDTVGTLSSDVAGAIAAVEAAVQPVLMTATDTVGTLSNDVAGAIAAVEAAVQPVLTTATDTVAAVDPTAIAGDVIALKDAPPPPANALFTGNQYTDYGVTLSSDIAVSPQHAASPVDSASAQDTLVPVVADVQQHAPPPDTTHPIDHLGHAIL